MNQSPLLSRRDVLRLSSAGVLGGSMSGWLESLAADTAKNPQRKRSCILLWMNGGPSQMDTFDLKPGHKNGGPFKDIATNAQGVRISEHLPKLAQHGDKLAVVRSMTTKEADHGRATYLMRTGRAPGGPIQYPMIGSVVAKELEQEAFDLPGFVSVSPYRFVSPGAFGPGFLGPKYAPLVVGENGGVVNTPGGEADYAGALRVLDLDLPGGVERFRSDKRLKLLDEMEDEFGKERPDGPTVSHRTAYHRAVRMMHSEAVKAFNIDEEPKALREKYGKNLFGQGCLLARRLVERGVPFVEVSLSNIPNANVFGWDTHQDNFNAVKKLSAVLDLGFATLLEDLKQRGLLATTTVVWMGEFGRTPRINGQTGRDHWANSWSTVLAGGGIKGGQVVGKTSADGSEIVERPVSVIDLLATVCHALGLDPMKQNPSNVGRPIRLVEPTAKAIKEVLA